MGAIYAFPQAELCPGPLGAPLMSVSETDWDKGHTAYTAYSSQYNTPLFKQEGT